MAHTTEVIAIHKLNNGQISVCIRCCGNPSTDHWHTMAHDVVADPERRKSSVGQYHDLTALEHANIEKAMAEQILKIGTDALKKEHEV